MTGKFYYDASKQRTAIIEEVDTRGGGQEFFRIINIYSEVHVFVYLFSIRILSPICWGRLSISKC